MYDFERGIERKGTNCVKWDVPFIKQTDLPMWIADMDFQIAPAIQNNLKKVAGQGAFWLSVFVGKVLSVSYEMDEAKTRI